MSDPEYVIKSTGSGVVLSGPRLTKPVRLPRADQAESLARHLMARNRGIITTITSKGIITKEKFAGKAIYSRAC